MSRLAESHSRLERAVDPDSDSTIHHALEEGLLMGSLDKHTLRRAVDARGQTRPDQRDRTRGDFSGTEVRRCLECLVSLRRKENNFRSFHIQLILQ
ncbi:hypothetical protein PoB_006552200 [Plakobranchus ocellatus]|uniref:Uncharacterized protein n=1 Tax=Plakobranchus ocellatus TaxID=259542 RepID=A0AAV4D493_9GAST|nr:hypothetical protein PoB_006552200 [Plakobranchus ocellatus]